MSWIEKAVLLYLVREPEATMKQMRPESVEPNLFAYHLEKLQAQKYVQKVGRGRYALTPEGLRHVGALSTATNKQSEYIKTVILLYGRADDGRYLLFNWSRQPYLHQTSLVQDHLSLGTSLAEGLLEAVSDKLGLPVVPEYRRSVLVRILHRGEIVTHMNGLVYEVPLEGLGLPYTSRNGTAFLGRLDDHPECMEGLADLLLSVAQPGPLQEFILTY